MIRASLARLVVKCYYVYMKTYLLLLICILFISMTELSVGDDFMIGWSHDSVVELLGSPTREIKTGESVLLFYGSVFLELDDDGVFFVNVSDEKVLEERRIADVKRGIYWGRFSEEDGDANSHAMTEEELEEWTEVKRRQRDMVVETRVRRFLLTQTLRSVLAKMPLVLVTSQASDSDSKVHMHNLSASRATSVIGLKDSHGRPVPAVGESSGYVDRYISFDESFFAEGE